MLILWFNLFKDTHTRLYATLLRLSNFTDTGDYGNGKIQYITIAFLGCGQSLNA